MSQTAKLTLLVLAIAGGVMLLVCSGTAAWLFFSVRSEMAPPENIRVSVSSPDQVTVGQTFTITVRVSNDANQPQLIDSIDIYDSYLAGVRLRTSQPAWQSSQSLMDFVTYAFGLSIPPRSEQVVTFEAVALRPGDFSGDFDVCINSEVSYITQVVRTIVTERDAAARTSPDHESE